MGTLYRPKVIEYRLPDGKARTPDGKRVTRDTPGVVRLEKQSRMWWRRYRDAAGNPHQVKLSPSKEIARRMLRALEGKAELGSVGIQDDDEFEKWYAITLDKHLDDFAGVLLVDGDGDKHVKQTVRSCRELLTGCGVLDLRGVAALDSDEVAAWLASQRRERPLPPLPPAQQTFTCAEATALVGCHSHVLARTIRRMGLEATGNGKARRIPRATVEALRDHFGKGMSPRTSNFYLGALKHFTKWLSRLKTRRIPFDPLKDLERVDEEADLRMRRRTLPHPEFVRLLTATRSGPVRCGLTGEARWVLYQTAARTGLRASELRSLTPASVDLDELLVTARASRTKNSKEAHQPIREELRDVLSAYMDGVGRHQPLFPEAWYLDAAEMLRTDLESAGIPYLNDQGEQYDFHALRAQYITDLVRAGNNPADVQRLARHSTITLTMQVYTKVRMADLRAAVDKLPSLEPVEEPPANPAQEKKSRRA